MPCKLDVTRCSLMSGSLLQPCHLHKITFFPTSKVACGLSYCVILVTPEHRKGGVQCIFRSARADLELTACFHGPFVDSSFSSEDMAPGNSLDNNELTSKGNA